MKKLYIMIRCTLLFFSISLILASSVQAQATNSSERVQQAEIENIPSADLGNGYYRNPVLVGPGADNMVTRVGEDYYMVAGGDWPEQLVWHSRDLVNWRPLIRALDSDYAGEVWASDLIYHEGTYYIYTTYVDASRGDTSKTLAERMLTAKYDKDEGDRAWKNIVITAQDPAGPWSEPRDLEVYGVFDPGHVTNQQGNRYLYFNNGTMIQLTDDGLDTVGQLKKVYDGWSYPNAWVDECFCLEAHKFTYHNGYYYMLSAQGGTGGPSTAHMIAVARSKSPTGPWQNSPYNPMVRTTDQDQQWWRQGHGTLIDDTEGNWWVLYTGYENGYEHYRKQSLLLPVEWTKDGWPIIKPGVDVNDVIQKPTGENVGHGMPLSDDFNSSKLGIQWMYPPGMDTADVLETGNGKLVMQAGGNHPTNANHISVMPVNHVYETEVQITISGKAEGGLMLNGELWISAGLNQQRAFAKWPRVPNYLEAWDSNTIYVRIHNDRKDVSAFYSRDGERWTQFDKNIRSEDANKIMLYAAGEGEVTFRNFKYRGLN